MGAKCITGPPPHYFLWGKRPWPPAEYNILNTFLNIPKGPLTSANIWCECFEQSLAWEKLVLMRTSHANILFSWEHLMRTFCFHENIAWEHFVLIKTFHENTFISCKHLSRTSLFSWLECLFKQLGWKCLQMWEGL